MNNLKFCNIIHCLIILKFFHLILLNLKICVKKSSALVFASVSTLRSHGTSVFARMIKKAAESPHKVKTAIESFE